MSQGNTGRNQHFVPQQMIRHFAGPDGKLLEMVKPELRIGTRRRAPRGLLFGEDFYRDTVSDFDAEFFKGVEQRFAHVYAQVLKGVQLDGDGGAAFIDWVAAMLVRTRLLTNLMPAVPERLPKHVVDPMRNTKKLSDNMARSEWFRMYQDLFARTGWRWKLRRFQRPCLILTDHPVGITSIHQEGGQVVCVPMASDTVIFGGAPNAVERMRDATTLDVNFFLAAWAGRHIFAVNRDILESVKGSLSDTSPFAPELVAAARQPFFGAPNRMRHRMLSSPMSHDFDFQSALRKYTES